MFRVPESWSMVIEGVSIVLLVGSLVVCALGGNRRCWWIVAAALTTSIVLDQHRLQPWAYQSMIYATLFASLPWPAARRWMMPLAISVYVYSGLGKLDYQFAHSVGQEMIAAATRPFGGLPENLSQQMRASLALILPAGECLAGLCLILKRLRPIAGSLLIAMHAVLIGLLGPWGLNHSWGVLIWNALLIVQAWFLFVRPGDVPSASAAQTPGSGEQEHTNRRASGELAGTAPQVVLPAGLAAAVAGSAKIQHRRVGESEVWRLRLQNAGQCLARGLVIIALVAPLVERAGYWDHWLSWALYAPHSSRVDVDIHRSAQASLSESLRCALQADDDGDGWQRLSLSAWSLKSLAVPIYPQARYQLGLTCEIAERYQLGAAVRAKIRGPADRWSGERSVEWVLGQSELRHASESYWLGQ
jgi:hypothetical protein